MNCTYMPLAVRAARLAEVEHPGSECDLPPSGRSSSPRRGRSKRRAEATVAAPARKKTRSGRSGLSSKVDQLSAELAQMRSMLGARQPAVPLEEGVCSPPMPELTPEDDALSLAASATCFHDREEDEAGDGDSLASELGSHSSAQGSIAETEDGSMNAVLRMALDRLQLEVPQPAGSAPASAFFRRKPAYVAFAVPHSVDYLRELQSAWRDTGACSRLSADGRALAAMHDAARVGLERMPDVEPDIASLILSPDEALRRGARCPRPQCRLTDDLLIRAYDAGARAGRIGNSLSHLVLALSASLQEGSASADSVAFCDASLEAFGLLSREVGRMMSILVQARRQVWLSQSSLTEASRRTLRSLPVEPGEVFGPAALETLQRTIQAGQTRQQLAGLRQLPPSNRPRGTPATSRARLPPPARSSGRRGFRRPVQGPARDFQDPDRRPAERPRVPDFVRPPPHRPPRGRGARK